MDQALLLALHEVDIAVFGDWVEDPGDDVSLDVHNALDYLEDLFCIAFTGLFQQLPFDPELLFLPERLVVLQVSAGVEVLLLAEFLLCLEDLGKPLGALAVAALS